VSEGNGKSTDQTSAFPANTPLIPERQIINHARVISGFSNPHENSAVASVHKVILSNKKKKKGQTNRRARRAGYPFAYTKESEDKPHNVKVRKKLRDVCQSWSDKGEGRNTYKRFAPMCLWRTAIFSELKDV
jgi:hypothetical protein